MRDIKCNYLFGACCRGNKPHDSLTSLEFLSSCRVQPPCVAFSIFPDPNIAFPQGWRKGGTHARVRACMCVYTHTHSTNNLCTQPPKHCRLAFSILSGMEKFHLLRVCRYVVFSCKSRFTWVLYLEKVSSKRCVYMHICERKGVKQSSATLTMRTETRSPLLLL